MLQHAPAGTVPLHLSGAEPAADKVEDTACSVSFLVSKWMKRAPWKWALPQHLGTIMTHRKDKDWVSTNGRPPSLSSVAWGRRSPDGTRRHMCIKKCLGFWGKSNSHQISWNTLARVGAGRECRDHRGVRNVCTWPASALQPSVQINCKKTIRCIWYELLQSKFFQWRQENGHFFTTYIFCHRPR